MKFTSIPFSAHDRWWAGIRTLAVVFAVTAGPVGAIDPVPPPVGAVAGVVSDAETGESIAGARVMVLSVWASPTDGNTDRLMPPYPDDPSTTTDENGRYRFEELPVGGWTLNAGAAGYQQTTGEVEVVEGGTATLNFDLTVQATGAITGVVTDAASGLPIAGANVGTLPRPMMGMPLPDDNYDQTTITDENGVYSLEGLPVGGIPFIASAAGYYQQIQDTTIVEDTTVSLDFALIPDTPVASGALEGVVTNAETNEPIAGALVYVDDAIYPSYQSAGVLPGDYWTWSGVTDANGFYHIEPLPVGSLLITAQAEGYNLKQNTVEIPENQTATLNIALTVYTPPPAGAVTGHVTDAETQSPIAGAVVIASPPLLAVSDATEPGMPYPGQWRTETDETGHYLLTDLPAGPIVLQVSRDGYESATREAEVFEEETTTIDVALTPALPHPTGVIEGVVTDAESGAPIAGAVIELHGPLPWPEPNPDGSLEGGRVVTDENGAFRMADIPIGPVILMIHAEGYAPDEVPVEVTEEAVLVQIALIPITPPAVGAIQGTVTDAESGLPLAGVLVVIHSPARMDPVDETGQMSEMRTETNESGFYAFDAVPIGPTHLSYHAEGYGVAYREVEVVEGDRSLLDVALAPLPEPVYGALEGVVIDAETQQPLAGILVRAAPLIDTFAPEPWPGGIGQVVRAVTDENGFYRFENAPVGTVSVVVHTMNYEPAQKEAEVIENETTTLNFELIPIPPPPAGAVEGHVTDADGQALSGALIVVTIPWTDDTDPAVPPEDNRPYSMWKAVTDESGHYEIGNIPPGPVTVTARIQDYEPGQAAVDILDGETVTADFVLTPLPPPAMGRISGIVRDAQTQEPIPGAIVNATCLGAATDDVTRPWWNLNQFRVLTDQNGQYDFGALYAGEIILVAWTRDYGRQSQTVLLGDGESLTIDVDLTPITDRDGDGKPDHCESDDPTLLSNGEGPRWTNAMIPDSDGDGLLDGQEMPGDCDGMGEPLTMTDPRNPDTDGDGYTDGMEVLILNTDPLDANDPGPDAAMGYDDGAGMPAPEDAAPAAGQAIAQDLDGDGYADAYELIHGADPLNARNHPRLGQINDDETANNLDAVILYNWALGNLEHIHHPENGDVNTDGLVNNIDAIAIFNWTLGNVPVLPL